MKLNCVEISISDEEFGCQITFSEKKDLREETIGMSVKDIEESIGRYLLLQRTYPEDEFESDYIYFETHNEEYAGELIEYEMALSRNNFMLKLQNEKIEVEINPTDREYSKLKEILPILTNNSGKINVNE
tara:strand:- start:872 stop:1261 length:390 start_codon:yes stop_codon:yes gene_type:complete